MIPELASATAVALDQNARVLEIMRKAGRSLTPWEVHQAGVRQGCQWLIGSVRRAMTTLSLGPSAPLVKLDTLRQGQYGKPSHEWCIATRQEP